MKIKVTDMETGVATEYDYSRNNWTNFPACMENGRVIAQRKY